VQETQEHHSGKTAGPCGACKKIQEGHDDEKERGECEKTCIQLAQCCFIIDADAKRPDKLNKRFCYSLFPFRNKQLQDLVSVIQTGINSVAMKRQLATTMGVETEISTMPTMGMQQK